MKQSTKYSDTITPKETISKRGGKNQIDKGCTITSHKLAYLQIKLYLIFKLTQNHAVINESSKPRGKNSSRILEMSKETFPLDAEGRIQLELVNCNWKFLIPRNTSFLSFFWFDINMYKDIGIKKGGDTPRRKMKHVKRHKRKSKQKQ